MSWFLSRQFIPGPAESGLAKWHTSEYPLASAFGFSGHFSLKFRVSLWPLAWGPLLLEHQACPATRVPTKLYSTHWAGINWLAKHTPTVSSGSARMTYIRSTIVRPCGWASLTGQTYVHCVFRHLCGRAGLTGQTGTCVAGLHWYSKCAPPWPRHTASVWLGQLGLSNLRWPYYRASVGLA